MPKKWVVNASPIISLCNIDKASLLIELCDKLLIPKGVAEEINQGTEDDPAKIWLQQFGGSYIKDVGPIETVIRAWDLGQGETEVINWAFTNSGWTPVLDDRAARNCLQSLNRRVLGTIGIILIAKKEQKIKAVSPLLNQLDQIGFRISRDLINEAIVLSGEKGD
jgi:predicted nucleic acid-binding protein